MLIKTVDVIEESTYIKKNGLYISERDEQHLFLINPLPYITDKISTAPDELPSSVVINCLQNNIREILYIFLNYPLSISNLPWLPGIVKSYYRNKFLSLLPLVKFINSVNRFFENFLSCLYDLHKNPTKLNPYSLASLFSEFYRDFAKISESLKSVGVTIKQPCSYFDMEKFPEIERDRKYLMPLKLLQEHGRKYFSEYVSGFYLHGSFATKDYVRNWSDVDTLLIINKETLRNPDMILRLQKSVYNGTGLFYTIDPFQSHGFFVITEYDLDYYPETYFPVELFRFCESFLENDRTFEFKLRDCQSENMHIFWKDCLHYIRNMMIEKLQRNKLNNNDIRMLLHRIYIFPVFYLQAQGIHCYKKYSFDLARKDFTEKEWEPVQTGNTVWKTWNSHYGYRVMPSFLLSLSPFVSGILLKKYYDFHSDIYNKYSIDYEDLLLKFVQLLENTWQRLLTQYYSQSV
jgi:hypothetical protein